MLLASWNVNGIRAAYGKNFSKFISDVRPDVLCLQETKADKSQLPAAFFSDPALADYEMHWHSAQKKGYSGTAIFSKHKAIRVLTGLGIEEFDAEGRVLALEFRDFFIFSIYFPNSQDDVKRLPYKMAFNEALLRHASALAEKKPVLLSGDFNVAHTEIDLAHPKANDGTAGFHPDERAWFSRLLGSGFCDIWRDLHPEQKNAYTWWTYRSFARERNVGWRIDYFVISKAIADQVEAAPIWHDVEGSDHCPVGLKLAASGSD